MLSAILSESVRCAKWPLFFLDDQVNQADDMLTQIETTHYRALLNVNNGQRGFDHYSDGM